MTFETASTRTHPSCSWRNVKRLSPRPHQIRIRRATPTRTRTRLRTFLQAAATRTLIQTLIRVQMVHAHVVVIVSSSSEDAHHPRLHPSAIVVVLVLLRLNVIADVHVRFRVPLHLIDTPLVQVADRHHLDVRAAAAAAGMTVVDTPMVVITAIGTFAKTIGRVVMTLLVRVRVRVRDRGRLFLHPVDDAIRTTPDRRLAHDLAPCPERRRDVRMEEDVVDPPQRAKRRRPGPDTRMTKGHAHSRCRRRHQRGVHVMMMKMLMDDEKVAGMPQETRGADDRRRLLHGAEGDFFHNGETPRKGPRRMDRKGGRTLGSSFGINRSTWRTENPGQRGRNRESDKGEMERGRRPFETAKTARRLLVVAFWKKTTHDVIWLPL